MTEHYDPDEPEVDILGCNVSLSSEGGEGYCQPVDKPFYQEYSPTSDVGYYLSLVGNSRFRYRFHQMKTKTNSKMGMMKWLGSDPDHPFFVQQVI